PNLVSVKLSVTNPLPGTGSPGLHGNLTLGSTSNLASFSGNGTAAVTITGHLSDINHALVGLKYQPALNYNDDYGNSPADTFTICVDDTGNTGSGGNQTATSMIPLHINPVNDPPFVTGPSGTQTTLENTKLTFSATNLNALQVGDVDDNAPLDHGKPEKLTLT